MLLPKEVFILAVEDLKKRYEQYQFMVERDVAWTIQRKMIEIIEFFELPYDVFQDYPLEKGDRLKKGHDLVIVSKGVNYKDVMGGHVPVELLVRIKYEPSRYRHDLCDHQLPHNSPKELIEDIKLIEEFVHVKRANVGMTLLIDECGRHRQTIGQTAYTNWIEWGNYNDEGLNVVTLLTEFSKNH